QSDENGEQEDLGHAQNALGISKAVKLVPPKVIQVSGHEAGTPVAPEVDRPETQREQGEKEFSRLVRLTTCRGQAVAHGQYDAGDQPSGEREREPNSAGRHVVEWKQQLPKCRVSDAVEDRGSREVAAWKDDGTDPDHEGVERASVKPGVPDVIMPRG